MPVIARLAVLAAAALAFAAPAALAEDCENVFLPRAYVVITTVTKPGAVLADQMDLMDSYVKSCPDHAWINALGGELDLMIFKALRANNGGVVNQDAYNFLGRALQRSSVFKAGPAEGQQSRYNVLPLQIGTALDYSLASNSRKAIIESLAQLAIAGTVHPYLKAQEPLACEGWVTSDAQTLGYMVNVAKDKVLLPFVEAAAEACRTAPDRMDRLPLAVLVVAYSKLIKNEEVKDPAEIERLLIAARRAADSFMSDDGYHSLLFSEIDDRALTALIRKHGVHTGAGPATIDRSLWFKPEYIGSEVAVRSISYAFGEYWTPLAAGETGAPLEEVAKARNVLTSYIYQLKNQGAEAGLAVETNAMLREALMAFQQGDLRTPDALGRTAMPLWFYDFLIKTLTPAPDGE